MRHAEDEIALAGLADVSGILVLQERNLSSIGGSLSVPFSRSWFETAVASAQVIVARRNERVVGYLVSCDFAAQAHVPLVQAMLKVYPGTPGAYNYGPVCVSESERGRGLAGAMFAALRARLPEREAVAFIRADNTPSFIGSQEDGHATVAEFTNDGVGFIPVAEVRSQPNRYPLT